MLWTGSTKVIFVAVRVAVSVPLNVTDSQVSCRIGGNVTEQLAEQEKGVVVFGDKLEDDEED